MLRAPSSSSIIMRVGLVPLALLLASFPPFPTNRRGAVAALANALDDGEGDDDDYDDDALLRAVADDILSGSRELSSGSPRGGGGGGGRGGFATLARSSPECWTSSLSSIGRWSEVEARAEGDGVGVHASGSSYCASLRSDMHEAQCWS